MMTLDSSILHLKELSLDTTKRGGDGNTRNLPQIPFLPATTAATSHLRLYPAPLNIGGESRNNYPANNYHSNTSIGLSNSTLGLHNSGGWTLGRRDDTQNITSSKQIPFK
jgi:hypothetical protein